MVSLLKILTVIYSLLVRLEIRALFSLGQFNLANMDITAQKILLISIVGVIIAVFLNQLVSNYFRLHNLTIWQTTSITTVESKAVKKEIEACWEVYSPFYFSIFNLVLINKFIGMIPIRFSFTSPPLFMFISSPRYSTLAYSCTSKIALVHSSSLSSLQITDDGKQDSASRKQPADCKKISNPKGSPLHPYFVTGFCDGEGCFHVRICKKKGYKSGYRITPLFSIRLHKRDLALLELIKASLMGVGLIIKPSERDDAVQIRVESIEDLAVLINHFDQYPLITVKRADYLLFKQVFEMMTRKEHLTLEGLQKIIAIKASMNEGLSDEFKAAFPDVIPVQRPLVKDQQIQDPNWLAGFVSAEGNFFINIVKSKGYKCGFQVMLRISIAQHSRDEKLMRSLVEYLGCGNYYKHSVLDTGEFVVTGYSNIEKLILFFQKHRIEGIKALDFADFCKAALIVKEGRHTVKEGLDEIRKIKSGMNKGRTS